MIAGVETEARWRVVARFVVAVGLAALATDGCWHLVGDRLSVRAQVVGYPLYAAFDVDRYFDAFYLTALVFPGLAFVCHLAISSFGPLRRLAPRRHAPKDSPNDAPTLESSGAVGRIGRVIAVGLVLGLSVAVGFSPSSLSATSIVVIVAACWCAFIAVTVVLFAHGARARRSRVRGIANSVGVGLALIGLGRVSGRTSVIVGPAKTVHHFNVFPWPLALAAALVAAIATTLVSRRGSLPTSELDRPALRYLGVPIAIFLVVAVLPGALGHMDAFGEGEYLAAGYLLVHGALPWRDLTMIHGLLDDGLKPLVGYAVFGMSRWGATAGITFYLVPGFFISWYLYAAQVLRRRFVLVLAAAIAFTSGVLVDWDIRFLLYPVMLITLLALLRRPSWRTGAALGFALVAEAALVPELTLAIPALGATVIAADCYDARTWRLCPNQASRTLSCALGGAVTSVIFGIYLVATRSLSAFLSYYEDFATDHRDTGGLPLYPNYSLEGKPDRYGVLHFFTVPTPLTTRYGLELVLPVVFLALCAWIVVADLRGGRRLTPEHFLAIATAGMVALYFQKSISRGDNSHIGEVFAVSTSLLIVLVGLIAERFDSVVADATTRARERVARAVARRPSGQAIRGALTASLPWSSAVTTALVLVVALLAPISPMSLADAAPSHFSSVDPFPALPAPIPGGPSLGFSLPDALPPGLVSNLRLVFDAEAGAHGAVFDLSDAPAVTDFLLERPPGSRFYDISLALTEASQNLVIADLERSKPPLVVFTGEVGLPIWDFIPNEIHQFIVSNYVLDHYRPLVLTTGELILISDAITHPNPLPKLRGRADTTHLDFSQAACAWGYTPNFLAAPSAPPSATTLVLHRVASHVVGQLYEAALPRDPGSYQWLSLTRSGNAPAKVIIGNQVRASGADIQNHDISWVQLHPGTVSVSVGSCLQWHGFGHTLFVHYVGPGRPSSVTLFNG